MPERMGGRALAAAAAVLFAFAAWLAAPLHAPRAGRPLTVAIYDRSESVERTRPESELWLRANVQEEQARARAAGHDFAALVFAGDRAWWLPPGDARRAVGLAPALRETRASDLAGALDLARIGASEHGANGGTVRLYTDGRATGTAVDASLRAFAQAGFATLRGTLAPPALDDVALVALRAPRKLEAGAPLACEVEVHAEFARGPGGSESGAPRKVRVELATDRPQDFEPRSFERAFDPRGGDATWRFDLGPAPAGGVRIVATVSLAGDPIRENDSASARVDVGGALRIAVVTESGALSDAAALPAWIGSPERWPGLRLAPTTPAQLPLELAHADAVWTLDVGAMPAELLRDFLRGGGGWLDCAGDAALHSAVLDASTSARALLPLAPEAPARPPRDVLLLIDGSGSMAGGAFDAVRIAALALADVVPPKDRLLLA
ncbi:MAG TPA: vWA domain-containing protein, partial [Planctomycetota bacterium]|nr:vWA domain-containing protein [Planctomycetota bacterium]